MNVDEYSSQKVVVRVDESIARLKLGENGIVRVHLVAAPVDVEN